MKEILGEAQSKVLAEALSHEAVYDALVALVNHMIVTRQGVLNNSGRSPLEQTFALIKANGAIYDLTKIRDIITALRKSADTI